MPSQADSDGGWTLVFNQPVPLIASYLRKGVALPCMANSYSDNGYHPL
ncbi:hypothetical protein [Prochlorococcus sp. MIT 1303]|nr:hypothetical protein [Prochlorococcus sp. MIT 1303]KZR65226.1 hypothetical protein PMIT1303_01290 [Prochlorococcus sp. MIT 1303]